MIKYICDHCKKEAMPGAVYTLTASRPVGGEDFVMKRALSDRHICRDCLLSLWGRAPEPEPKPKPELKEPEPITKKDVEQAQAVTDTVAKMLTVEEPEKKPHPRGKLPCGKQPEKTDGLPQEQFDRITGKNLKRRFYLTKADEPVIRERYRNGEEIEDIANAMGLGFACVSVFIANEGLGKERYKGQAIPDHGGQPVMPVTTGVYKVKGGR